MKLQSAEHVAKISLESKRRIREEKMREVETFGAWDRFVMHVESEARKGHETAELLFGPFDCDRMVLIPSTYIEAVIEHLRELQYEVVQSRSGEGRWIVHFAVARLNKNAVTQPDNHE